MRKYMFRGKSKDGRWVYGLLHKSIIDNLYIIDNTYIRPETIGQYIGRNDINNKEIYDGDICENGDWEENAHAYNYRIEEIVYIESEAMFRGWNFNEDGMTCEVIGNIHDNSELLEKEIKNERIQI